MPIACNYIVYKGLGHDKTNNQPHPPKKIQNNIEQQAMLHYLLIVDLYRTNYEYTIYGRAARGRMGASNISSLPNRTLLLPYVELVKGGFVYLFSLMML